MRLGVLGMFVSGELGLIELAESEQFTKRRSHQWLDWNFDRYLNTFEEERRSYTMLYQGLPIGALRHFNP